MKTILTALMCIVIAFSALADREPEVLTLHGYFLSKSIVKYQVCVLAMDTVVNSESKTGIRTYRINLEVGKSYIVEFTKGDITKTLYITVEVPGEAELDVDFTSGNSCRILYDKQLEAYAIILIKPDEYVVQRRTQ